MWRKGIVNLLALLLVSSIISGCGASDYEESYDNDDKYENNASISDDITSTTSKAEEIAQKSETTHMAEEETTTAAETPEKETGVVDFGGIKSTTAFSDGVAYIHTNSGENYAIDGKGNILFSLGNSENTRFPEKFINGTAVWYDERLTDKNGDTMCCIIDKNGYILTKPSKDGYDGFVEISIYNNEQIVDFSHRAGNYILAYKQEKKFNGDITYFGVMDNYGNWVKPLSADYKICELMDDISSESLVYLGDSVVFYKSRDYGYCYDFIEDEIIATIGSFDNPYLILGDTIYCRNKIYSISKNKEIYTNIPLYETNIVNLGNAVLYANLQRHSSGNKYFSALYGANGELLIDLSDYQFSYSYYQYSKYEDGYLVAFIMNSQSSDNYLAVFNPNGELAFEPININPNLGSLENDLYFHDGIVTISESDTLHQYDLNGNEITNIKLGQYIFGEFYKEENLYMLLIPNKGRRYYDLDGNLVIQ